MSQSEGAGGEDVLAAKRKATIFFQKKGLLSEKDFKREDIDAMLGADDYPGGGRVVNIHDSDPKDSIYAWDFDGVDAYYITNPDATDPTGGGHG
jgi:hypothetical protein